MSPATPKHPLDKTLPAHFECDCVPDLGPSHCHRCSQLLGTSVPWSDAPCAEAFSSEDDSDQSRLLAFGRHAALTAGLTPESGIEPLLRLVLSASFDVFVERTEHVAHGEEGRAEDGEQATGPVDAEPVVAGERDDARPAPAVPAPGHAEELESRARPASPATSARAANRAALAVPAPSPSAHLPSAAEQYEASRAPAPWRFTHLARDQAKALGLTERDVVDLVKGAPLKTGSERGGVNHYADGYLILVDADGECVISVIEREAPIAVGSSASSTAAAFAGARPTGNRQPKAKSGGPGRRMPSNAKELNALLKEHGFLSELRGGHWHVTHPDHPGVRVVFPATPSDSRSYPNCIAQLKRDTGIDITAPVPKKKN